MGNEIDYSKWNEQFGGEEAKKALQEAEQNNQEFTELPDGTYICKLEKLELAAAKSGKPMIKGQFRILEGEHKKQCLFYNHVFCRGANGSGYPIKLGLDFLRSLDIFPKEDIDFSGDYKDFANLLLDMAEEAEAAKLKFEIKKSMDGDYSRLEITDVIE